MAFDNEYLQEIGPPIGRLSDPTAAAGTVVLPRIWSYGTNDDNAALVAADYALDSGNRMNINDIILASYDQDGTPATHMYRVDVATRVDGLLTAITWSRFI